ncbi:MAG: hypothetical protein IJR87_08200 [Bacteroidaceae bacterium]|nr:hypothetical protein [Bacteroidaceae bacterium]
MNMRQEETRRRPYERLQQRVVQLQQQAQLMQTSAKRTSYGPATQHEWD